MKNPSIALILALVLSITVSSQAQRVLDEDETLDILKELTRRGRTTWISAGVIEASHEAYVAPTTTDEDAIERQIQQEIKSFEANPDEILCSEELQASYLEAIPFNVRYRLANESTTSSSEVVKYDGERFYWKISINSRNDSVYPTGDLADNYMTEAFDLTWNEQRIYAWDGATYTIYSVSGQYATVDADNRYPRAVNGPLTAGFVNWGQGGLGYDQLAKAELSAIEVDRNGMTQTQLTVLDSDGTSKEFFLAPSMDYAVTSCTLFRSDDTATTIYCDGYEEIGDRWVPSSILIEKRDAISERLLRSDKWEITVVDSSSPKSDAFTIDLYDNTAVEYCSAVHEKTSLYHYANATDTDAMLTEHLTYAARKGKQKQNCATAALKYAASRLGASVSDDKLAALVNPRGQTSLYDLKQCAEELGLYCVPFKADLSTLASLPECQALIVQPGNEHLMVIDRVDSERAWIVDLTHKNFYRPQDIDSIGPDSTIMLLSGEPKVARAQCHNRVSLNTMVGEAAYSCTDLLQAESAIACDEYCSNIFYWYYERWGCELAQTGSCTSEVLPRFACVECYLRPDGVTCGAKGDWYFQPMYACL